MALWQNGMEMGTNLEGISIRETRSQEYKRGSKECMEIH